MSKPQEQWRRGTATIVPCPQCGIRRLYGRGPVCLACRMDDRDQANQERRRRFQVASERVREDYSRWFGKMMQRGRG